MVLDQCHSIRLEAATAPIVSKQQMMRLLHKQHARIRVAARVHRALKPSAQSSADSDLPKGPAMESEQSGMFNAQAFLDSAGVARTIVEYQRAEVIFTQAIPVRASCTSKRVA
jgi:hypothetical protein